MVVFRDRRDAGRQLAQLVSCSDPVILGLPRGGVPVAFEVARALNAPLDVIVVRKLGVPFQPELAMGAIGEGGVRVLESGVLDRLGLGAAVVAEVEQVERARLEARVALYRKGRPRIDLTGRTVVIVDDGLATGSTARAACQVARGLGAATVILAVPVGPLAAVRNFPDADAVVCVSAEKHFRAVGLHYRDFRATSDDEVVALLESAPRPAD